MTSLDNDGEKEEVSSEVDLHHVPNGEPRAYKNSKFAYSPLENENMPQEAMEKPPRKMIYTTFLVRYPYLACVAFFIAPIVLSIIGLAGYPIVIDYGIDSFQATGNKVVQRTEAFQSAQLEYKENLKEFFRKYHLQRDVTNISLWNILPVDTIVGGIEPFPERNYLSMVPWELPHVSQDFLHNKRYQYRNERWFIHLVFKRPRRKDNVLEEVYLKRMHEIVRKFQARENYGQFCSLTDNTVTQRSECTQPATSLRFFFPEVNKRTGSMKPNLKGDRMIDISKAMEAIFLAGEYAYTDENFDPSNPYSNYLRMQFPFGIPVGDYVYGGYMFDDQYELWKNWIMSQADFLSSLSTGDLHVMYGGDTLTEFQILDTIYSDARYSIGSLILVFSFMWVSTGSLFLAVAGMFEICVSFPLVYFFFRVPMGVRYTGVLNALSLFVIIGIGVDDVFIFFNVFQQFKHIEDLELRMAATFARSAKATFITSFTTAAAFVVNAISEIPALRYFGLFMSMMVTCNWLMVITWYPTILVLWVRGWVPLTHRFSQLFGISRCLDKIMPSRTSNSSPKQSTYRKSEGFFKFYFSPMIIKGRWIFFVGFLIILGIATYETTKLRPSNHVPNLFKPSSNLQQFLSWKISGFFEGTNDEYSGPLLYGCDEVINSGITNDICGVCLGNCSTCLQCDNTTTTSCKTYKKFDRCGVCGGNDTACAGCDGIPWSYAEYDVCGVCGGHGQSCAGCDGLPWSNTTTDACGQCGGDNSTCAGCDGVPWSYKVYDQCGVCGGDGSTCGNEDRNLVLDELGLRNLDCNTTYDICGECGGDNSTCVGCDGVINSTAQYDACGVCGGDDSSCLGCDGVVNSHKEYDICGICGGDNSTCTGCDGVLNSQTQYDNCGVCGGKNLCKVRHSSYESVEIVWGIEGIDSSNVNPNDLFEEETGKAIYDKDFDISYEENQLAVIEACEELRKSGLVHAGGRCIMEDFRDFNLKQGLAFPMIKENFTLSFGYFIYTNRDFAQDAGFGYKNEGDNYPQTIWIRLHFESDLVKGTPSFEAYEYFNKLEGLLAKFNERNPKTLNNAVSICPAWKIMMTEVVAVNGIKFGLIVSLTASLVSVLVFTLNIIVSIFVVITIIGNIICMLAFFQLVGWTLGAVEALSITVLVGLSVDYVLHMADAYVLSYQPKNDTRAARLTDSLTHMGMSVFSGAVTTIFSIVMLSFCQLEIFVKFGMIIAANIFLSIVFTLFFFTALLAILGPTGKQGSISACIVAIFRLITCRRKQQKTDFIPLQNLEDPSDLEMDEPETSHEPDKDNEQ